MKLHSSGRVARLRDHERPLAIAHAFMAAMRSAPRLSLIMFGLVACNDDGSRHTDLPPMQDAASEQPRRDAGGAASLPDGGAIDRDANLALPVARDGTASGGGARAIRLPPVDAPFDYQLGEPYPPAQGVQIVTRDRTASPVSGIYNICYVNGLQVQESERTFWLEQHPALLLRDASGKPVIDADWNEMLLDISSEAKRAELAAIVGGFIRGCAQAGFSAVEVDNLDSYARSRGRLTSSQAVDYMKLLSATAHDEGLAIAQKNATELVAERSRMGTDFAVAEECSRYRECEDYTRGYGQHVLVIEYRQADFTTGCAEHPELSIVLRDVELVGRDERGYLYDGC